MKKYLLILTVLAASFVAKASHIVGGEFELRHVQGMQYRLNLILYFDKVHGLRGAKDQQATVSIFRMVDNVRMLNITLPLTDSAFVQYTNIACISEELETQKLIYTAIINLPADDFNHAGGYYVSWQRCCRNYVIDNIFSQNPNFPNGQPNPNAIFAGQTFYLEFPPVSKNGAPFIDSTPELFPPLSDYGCVGKPYYVNFGGTDVDEDSLVYSLVNPLNTITAAALPPGGLPRPKPGNSTSYPFVTWRPGFGLNNVMGGNPELVISDDGWLTVTPQDEGLFVFAVKCEEYRNGVKIGETRRDFQMLVTVCDPASAPVVKGRKLGESTFSHVNTMSVSFPHSITSSQRCIEIEITDNDIFGNEGQEFVAIQAVIGYGKNRKKLKNEVMLPVQRSAILNPANSSVIFKVCFDECPPEKDTPYQIGIIVKDDACALPLLDTLRITVFVEAPPNSPATFLAPVPNVTKSLFEGTSDQWPVEAVDPDGDTITLAYTTNNFMLTDVGMDFDFVQTQIDHIKDTLVWDAKCDLYDFSQQQFFKIQLLVDDKDKCSYNKADTAVFNLTLINPSADPVIDTDLTPVFSERYADAGIHKIYDNAIQFNLFGRDNDPFPIELKAEGIGFDLSGYAINFPGDAGVSPLESPFTWTLSCDQFNLMEKDTFAIRFVVMDKNNKCKIYQADTVEVGFKILPPPNTAPELTWQNLHPETNAGPDSIATFWDKPIEILVTGNDPDNQPVADNLTLELIDVVGIPRPPQGYSFLPEIPLTAPSQVQTKFSWAPDCSIFVNNRFNNTYTFAYRVVDDRCQISLADTISIAINIQDYISTDENFLPPNTITPNGDQVNDFFAFDGYDLRDNGSDPDGEINLPLDNCLNQFEYINIYNRWGKLVFTSTNRFFRWYAPDAGAGVYYYFLKFTRDEYKSSIMVRY